MISRILRGILIASALLLVLALALRMALRSDTVLEWVRATAEKQLNQQLHPQAEDSLHSGGSLPMGTFHIGTLRGDLLFGVIGEDLQLLDSNGQMIASAEQVEINYSLPEVLTSHRVRSLRIDRWFAGASYQEENEQWNWQLWTAGNDSTQPSEAEPELSFFEWELDHLSLTQGEIRVESAVHLPDTTLSIKEIHLTASASVQQDGYRAALHSLTLNLHEGRFPDPVFLYASATSAADSSEVGSNPATKTNWNLTSLLLQTGKTILDVQASVNTATDTTDTETDPIKNTLSASLALLPLSHEDLNTLAQQTLLNEPIEARLELTGSVRPGPSVYSLPIPEQIGATITITSKHLGKSTLRMQTTPGNPLILESAAIEVTDLQTEKLTGLSNLPNIESLRWKATGEIPLLQPLNARFASDLEVRTITYTPSAKGRVDGRATENFKADHLFAEITVQDTILTVQNGRIESPLGELTLTARQHLLRGTDPDNRMELNAVVKDPSSLRQLTNQPIQLSKGFIKGTIKPNQNGQWQFEGSVSLEDVSYLVTEIEEQADVETESVDAMPTEFRASIVRGNVWLTAGSENDEQNEDFFASELHFAASLAIEEPSFGSYSIRDARFELEGFAAKQSLNARTLLDIQNPPFSRLMHQSAVQWRNEILTITTDSLLFSSPVRDLHLQKPFNIEIQPQDRFAKVDTLYLESEDRESFLMAWAPEIRPERQEAQIYVQNILLGALQMAILKEPLFEATLSGSASVIRDDATGLSARTNLMIEQTALLEGVIDSILVFAELENDLLDIQSTASMAGRPLWEVVCELPVPERNHQTENLPTPARSDCKIDLQPTPMRALTPFLPNAPNIPENTNGLLSASAHLTGSIQTPSMEGHILLQQATLSGIPVDSITTDLSYHHETEELTLNGNLILRKTPALTYDAHLPFRVDLEQRTVTLPAREIRVTAGTNQFNLAVFNDFLQEGVFGQSGESENSIAGLGGFINGQISIRVDANAFSTEKDPDVAFSVAEIGMDGEFILSGGTLDIDPYGIRLRNIESTVRLEPGLITLDSFSVKSGPGTLDASGSIDLRQQSVGGELARNAGLDFTLKGRRFALADSRTIKAVADLDASLSGTMNAPIFNGSAQILSGFIVLSGFGETKVEEVDLRQMMPDGDKPLDITPKPSENLGFWDRLSMDLGIRTNRRFFIRNRDLIELELELGGEIDLVKEPGAESEPALFGTISGLGGYTKTLGKEFRFEEAEVTFSGDPFNPGFRMRTSYEPPRSESEIKLFYIIEGTLENPVFRFESNPEMELQDIISYTVFGKPFYELQSWEQVVAGSGEGTSATELAVEVLLDRVEVLASEQLGIDVVRIDNQQRGSDRATSILTGWYLDRRTFFAMINELSSDPKTLFVIEYLLTEELELILIQGDDSRQGVDIRWEYDY